MVYISFTKGFKDNQTNKKIQLTKWNSEEIDFDKLFFFLSGGNFDFNM